MNLSELTADHIGHLVTIQADRATEGQTTSKVRYVGVLESFEMIWSDDSLVVAGLRISGHAHSLNSLKNGALEDYTVEVKP